MGKMKLKKGDKVQVIAGASKGSTGAILKIMASKNTALVEGVNMVKKHNKPSAQNPQGGITEKEAPLHISNLALVTADGTPTRAGYRMEEGKKVRYAKKSNEVI
jgi:large subunit ribosomal protein L24